MKIGQTQQNTAFAGHTVVTFKEAQKGMCKAAKRIAQERGAIAQGSVETALLLMDNQSVLVLDRSITDKATKAFRGVYSRVTQALTGLAKSLKACYSKGTLQNERAIFDTFRKETLPDFILELIKEGKLTRIEA